MKWSYINISSNHVRIWPYVYHCSLSSEHCTKCTITAVYLYGGRYGTLLNCPFSQIDIIEAIMTVWRVRGKIIRSVLCSIVCNNCVQCNAHTYEQT